MTNSPSKLNPHRYALAAWLLLTAYWLVLSIGTHLPPVAVNTVATINDKAIHAGAYFLFALLAASAWRLTFRRFHRLAGLALLLLLAVVGALDEVTQPYFHRSCDLGDWLADVVGAATGLVLFRIFMVGLAVRRAQQAEAAEAVVG